MSGLMLILRIAGETVALPTDAVESVIEIEVMTPIPLAPPHVAGLAALRSRVLTIIDSHAALGRARPQEIAGFSAVIVVVEGHPYGIMVDEIIDVMPADGPIEDLCGPIDPAWATVSQGIVTIEGRLHLLLDPARMIAGPMLAAA